MTAIALVTANGPAPPFSPSLAKFATASAAIATTTVAAPTRRVFVIPLIVADMGTSGLIDATDAKSAAPAPDRPNRST
jgi:hypothetical protein